MATAESKVRARLREIEARLREMEKENKRLAKEKVQLARVLQKLTQAAGKIATVRSAKSSGGSGGEGMPEPHKGPKPAEVLAVAEAILRRAGKPMTRGELLQALRAEGFKFESTDPANTLGVTLSRSPWNRKFVHLKLHGYWLADLDYKPANYRGALKEEDAGGKSEPERAYIQ